MAQPGDTITYTFNGSKTTEDISDVDEIEIDYMHGAGGGNAPPSTGGAGGSGGRVENATADVSSYSTLEIWVAEGGLGQRAGDRGGFGRSEGGANIQGSSSYSGSGGGSTELWTDSNSTFIAAADAGGGAGHFGGGFFTSFPAGGGGGARGGVGGPPNGVDAGGTGNGGDGGEGSSSTTETGENGGGELGIASGGTITKGGGFSSETDAEIQVSYKQSLSPPDPPSNLSATVQ